MVSKMVRVIYFLMFIIAAGCSSLPVVQSTSGQKEESKQSTDTTETTLVAKIQPVSNSAKVNDFCRKIDEKFQEYSWGKSRCDEFQWNHVRNSVLGDPLIWLTFGDEKEHESNPQNSTMLFCGVHGDEITPVKFCFDAIYAVEKLDKDFFKNRFLVIAPIVNPDSFFKKIPSRTNHRNVDINRNFPTKDWPAKALAMWRNYYKSDKRRFPGKKAVSEPEVVFQMNIIKRYSPDKIISVHAPLTMWDYDGPDDTIEVLREVLAVREFSAKSLLVGMSKKSNNYRIKDYPVFPGSLGNWAGNERNIPTFTLELPTSDPAKTDQYWELFKNAIMSAFTTDLRGTKSGIVDTDDVTTKPGT